mmetsp:Transcript_30035/g.77867  ORF Transcript_30035/g.77867 Transcript_30035/m.77867 type:complete len:214 (+) Transcript_30035:566-1207(+)
MPASSSRSQSSSSSRTASGTALTEALFAANAADRRTRSAASTARRRPRAATIHTGTCHSGTHLQHFPGASMTSSSSSDDPANTAPPGVVPAAVRASTTSSSSMLSDTRNTSWAPCGTSSPGGSGLRAARLRPANAGGTSSSCSGARSEAQCTAASYARTCSPSMPVEVEASTAAIQAKRGTTMWRPLSLYRTTRGMLTSPPLRASFCVVARGR